MLPSTLHLMWHMHLRTLKLQWEDAFTRNTLFDLWLWSWLQCHMKCCLSTLNLMWPMHRLQILKLLLPKLYEEVPLQDTKRQPVPSIWCDLCVYRVWSCYVQRFRRRYNYKKCDGRTDGRTDSRTDARTDERRTEFGTKKIYPIFLTKTFEASYLWKEDLH